MVVSVVFRDNPKKYDYLTDILYLQRGEFVVVPVGPLSEGAFEVARVAEVKEKSSKATAWAVQRVDVAGWRRKMKEREKGVK